MVCLRLIAYQVTVLSQRVLDVCLARGNSQSNTQKTYSHYVYRTVMYSDTWWASNGIMVHQKCACRVSFFNGTRIYKYKAVTRIGTSKKNAIVKPLFETSYSVCAVCLLGGYCYVANYCVFSLYAFDLSFDWFVPTMTFVNLLYGIY